MAKSPEELYQEREKRFNDAIELKVPDRIPMAFLFTFYPAKYAGMSFRDVMYDYDKAAEAWRKAIVDLDIDVYASPFSIVTIGHVLEMLDDRRFKWPGHGVSGNRSYQFVEGEYMTSDEYDAFIGDPTDYMLRTHLSRIFGVLEPLKTLAYLPGVFYMWLNSMFTLPFANPEVSKALEILVKTGQESGRMFAKGGEFVQEMTKLGYPTLFFSAAWAPYDYIGDFFRGTRGIMLDMYQRPDKLLAAMDKITPIIINSAVGSAEATGVRRTFIPLHKGLDGFMSQEQFKTFFWPGLKKVILGLIDKNIVPIVLWEGDCTSRLETIADIPKGKAIYWFERTDMVRAKDVLRDRVCISGLVPSSLLCTGSQQDVKDYCKRLIDVVGKDGGYILNGDIGIPDEAKPENVKAMVDFTREYGVYK